MNDEKEAAPRENEQAANQTNDTPNNSASAAQSK